MALATIPGYPRIGKRRELKRALEGFWSGKRTAQDLEETAADVRHANWATQIAAGLDLVPVNDFSLLRPGARHLRPGRRRAAALGLDRRSVDLDLLFAMARGGSGAERGARPWS